MRAPFLEFVEDTEKRFILVDGGQFVQLNLADGDGI